MGVAHERDGQAACRQGQQRTGGARCQSPPALTTAPPASDPPAMPALNAMGCSDAENVRALG